MTLTSADIKRRDTLHLAQAVISAWNHAVAVGKTPASKEAVDNAMQALLGYLLDNYQGEVTTEKIRGVFSGSSGNLSAEYLDTLPEEVVPIAVVREVLFIGRVKYNPRAVTNMVDFAHRYGQYLMAA